MGSSTVITLPATWRCDHNAHFHPWLLRHLPVAAASALDVGCGAGVVARLLAERGAAVDAVDRAPSMIEQAAAQREAGATPRWIVGDVLDPALPLSRTTYDVVTAVASLHHLPLRPGLARLARLVAPGGTLAVVGLHRLSTVGDVALAPLTLLADALYGVLVGPLRARARSTSAAAGSPVDAGDMPLRDPTDTLPEIRAAAADLCPGAVVRRRLFWRYTLLWHHPTPADATFPGRVQ